MNSWSRGCVKPTKERGDLMNKNTALIPTWFWVVSVAGLLWNLIGVAAFVAQISTEPGSLSGAERTFHETTPMWATIAFTIAVFGGSLGCVALLLRKTWAYPILILSLLGIVIQILHSLVISNGFEVFGAAPLSRNTIYKII